MSRRYNSAAPLPVRMPAELRVSTLAEMEPGEHGWCSALAIRRDQTDKVWLDVACVVSRTWQEFADVRVQRHEHSFTVSVPNNYKFPRSYTLDGLFLVPVTSVEVLAVATESDKER